MATTELSDTAPARPEISFAIPCYNEEENVVEIYRAVTREAERHARSHEIIFIDNKSTDRTRELMREVCAGDRRVRAIFNNRNFGQMRSPTYAIYQAEGEAVIGMGADFQDPPALIGDLIRLWRAGAQVVLGQRRTEKASLFLSIVRPLGYRFLGRFADYPVIPGATGFGLFGREAIDTLAAWNEPEPFFRGMVVDGGFRIAIIPFERPQRAAGETKNNLRTLTDFALSSIAGSAKSLLRVPIMASLYLGVATAVLLLLGLAAPLWHGPAGLLLLGGFALGGYASLLLWIGLIGEQVRIISERTRNTPLVIEEERINFPEGRGGPARRTIVQPPETIRP